MEFRVLGPLEVSAAGRPLPLGGRKQRAVLAVLLLHANEVVSRDQLIDEVWGDAPPPEVGASLRVYVARLRKLLGTENGSGSVLETRPNGYALKVDPESLDLNRFRRLVGSGQQALAAGQPSRAAELLEEALGLWRGAALGDLAEEAWAQRVRAVLEELRLNALEERIDADLAAGRHADITPELEELAAGRPHRERVVGQLMLAFYRSGRQTDALQAYARARDALRDDFGLEPTRALKELERQILVQDPALDAPPGPVPLGTSGRRRRITTAMIVMAAAALALVLATMLLSSRRDGPGTPPKTVVIEGNSLVAIDALTNAVLGEVELGGRPSGVAAAEGDVWVGNRDDKTLLRIDARTRRVVRRIGLGVEPTELAVGAGSVWVLSAAANAVLEVDPAIGQVVDTVALEEPDALCCSYQLLFFRRALWITASGYLTGSVTRVVPTTHARITTDARKVRSLASDGRTLWGITGFEPERIERLDRRAAPIRVDRLGETEGLVGVAAGAGALWTVTPDGTLAKIDPRLGRVIVSVPLRHRVAGIAATDRAVWVVTKDGSVLRIDPATARLATSIPLGIVTPSLWGTIAVTDKAVWIATESTLDP